MALQRWNGNSFQSQEKPSPFETCCSSCVTSMLLLQKSPWKNSVTAWLKGECTGLNYSEAKELAKLQKHGTKDELVTLLHTQMDCLPCWGLEGTCITRLLMKSSFNYTVPLHLQSHFGKHCPVTPYKRQFQEAEALSWCLVSKAESPFWVSSTTKLLSFKELKSAGGIFLPYLSTFSRGFWDTLMC